MTIKTVVFIIKVTFLVLYLSVLIQTNAKHVEMVYGNPEERGPYFEGDLVSLPIGRNAKNYEALRWKNGVIPYVITRSFKQNDRNVIEQAFNHYHKNTCIKFILRRSSDKDFISLQNGSKGCKSSIGRSCGNQVVELQSPDCLSKIGTVIHELMHVVGFKHEQNREDRDEFVIIHRQNIQPRMEHNFEKAKKGETTSFGVAYSYGSVMHYSANAFSKNGQPTIEAKKNTQEVMGQRNGFSRSDIEKIRKMYKC